MEHIAILFFFRLKMQINHSVLEYDVILFTKQTNLRNQERNKQNGLQ